jgi:hypothetical protein
MSSPTDHLSAQHYLENQDIQVLEDEWWDLPTVPYLKYSSIPSLSRWMAKVIPGTSNMALAVEEKILNFPRQWISISFLLDLQQLSSLAYAIMHATSNPDFSERLYRNVSFLNHLRAHVIQSRLHISSPEFNKSWIPPALERWLLRQFHCLPNERGAYMALQDKYDDVYKSNVNVWNLGKVDNINNLFVLANLP